MTQNHVPFAASFWLGKIHSGIISILHGDDNSTTKLQKIEELELELREAVNRLYYANLQPD